MEGGITTVYCLLSTSLGLCRFGPRVPVAKGARAGTQAQAVPAARRFTLSLSPPPALG
jgi:hypothetical protein